MDTKRSCLYRETCCGVRVETATFIYSIINAIIVTAATIGCIVFFAKMLWIQEHPPERSHSDTLAILFYSFAGFFDYVSFIISIILLVVMAIADVFAVVLIVGISQKKARYLQAYLIYGIIIEILSVLGIGFIIISLIMEWNERGQMGTNVFNITTVVAVCACVIYIFPLWLVHQAYVVLSNSSLDGHKELINEQDDDLKNEFNNFPLV